MSSHSILNGLRAKIFFLKTMIMTKKKEEQLQWPPIRPHGLHECAASDAAFEDGAGSGGLLVLSP